MKNLKQGDIFSETQFYVVKEVKSNQAILTDEFGNDVALNENYINDLLKSADRFSKTEKKTMTELADLFVSNRGVAMTVCFTKKAEKKLVKDFKAEVAQWTENVKQAFLDKGLSGLEQFATTPVSEFKLPETRVMKGRHYGHMNDLGRIDFVDMEQKKGVDAKGGDTRMRQVDPRTIQYLIVDNVKYELK